MHRVPPRCIWLVSVFVPQFPDVACRRSSHLSSSLDLCGVRRCLPCRRRIGRAAAAHGALDFPYVLMSRASTAVTCPSLGRNRSRFCCFVLSRARCRPRANTTRRAAVPPALGVVGVRCAVDATGGHRQGAALVRSAKLVAVGCVGPGTPPVDIGRAPHG